MPFRSATVRSSCAVGLALLAAGCSDHVSNFDQVAAMASVNEIPDTVWSALASKSVYFGHQSVGDNILQGVTELLGEYPDAPLRVVRTADRASLGQAVIAHQFIGQNGDPMGKAAHFAELLGAGVGDVVDIAAMKFCYLDFTANSDYRAAFESYRARIESIRERHPELALVHLTLPLTSPQTGPKAWAKAVLGKPRRGYEDNAVRAAYNELLISEYGGRDAIFDLSALQSTTPDGSRFTVKVDGKPVPALLPAYTDDGGHLNALSRRIVARSFLEFLATGVNNRRAGEVVADSRD